MQGLVYPAERVHHWRTEIGERETVPLWYGATVCVRPVSSEDEERLRRMFSRLSLKTIYQRLHAPYPRVPEWVAASFTDVDHYNRESLVAVEGGEIVGHAMYVRSDVGHEAEFAVVVEDRCQSKGLGKLLLSELAEEAERRGIETLTGIVLGENRRMLGLIDSMFAGVRYTMKDGAYYVRVPLHSSERTHSCSPNREWGVVS